LGASATFTVSATGAPAPSFQWQRDGKDIPGATGTSYGIPVTTIAETGSSFTVVASNAAGSVTSRAALLSVNNPPVPTEFGDLYPVLQTRIRTFDGKVSAAWNGQKSGVSFGGELLTANGNRGLQLLGPTALAGVRLELDRLKALGLQSVVVAVGFPILHAPFFQYNGDPKDAAAFLAFYQTVAQEIHARNMKMVAKCSLLFTGSYTAGSGFDLAAYYASLSPSQLLSAQSEMAAELATKIQPDWINLGSEPDTQAALSGNAALGTPAGFAALIAQEVSHIRAAGSTIPLGAGVGTWQPKAGTFLMALSSTGIDYMDLHSYPLNDAILDGLVQLVDYAASQGKPVAISEVWASKERDSELGQLNGATDPTIFARDPFAFWAPLDQAFLGSLIKFAHWKKLIYLCPEWTKYYHAYVDYEAARGLTPTQVLALEDQAAAAAMQKGSFSTTGIFFSNAIR
jgi:hypothetical protein